MRNDDGWGDDDPEYLAARIQAVVERMTPAWRGRPLSEVEVELRRRLKAFGDGWPPELVEHLVRRVADPHWAWKHPGQAFDLSRRFHARAWTGTGES